LQSQLETTAFEDLIQIESDLERRSSGLSIAFESDFRAAVGLLLMFPEVGRMLEEFQVRRLNLKRFKYFLLYRVEDDIIVIYAVVHHAQDSSYWEDRFS
jgi:plasmid stabilization system protein ParE